jgi:hypothetical protein
VKTHQEIDQRSLALAWAVVAKIDADATRAGLEHARGTCARWCRDNPAPALAEWSVILKKDWEQIRAVLLEETEEGQRLRQSSPFCGVLSASERWAIYQRFNSEQTAA